MNEIKPCPGCPPEFAGIAPRVNTANGEQFWVFCPECGTHGPAGFSEEYAIERWNALCRQGVPETELMELHNWCREQATAIALNPYATAVVGEAYDIVANRITALLERHKQQEGRNEK